MVQPPHYPHPLRIWTPNWRVGRLTFLSALLGLALWTWFRLSLLNTPVQLRPHITGWMLALVALYTGTLLVAMAFTGANLRAPRLATWALLASLGLFGLITTAFLDVALWGTPIPPLWLVLVMTGIGSLGALWFTYTLWQDWRTSSTQLYVAHHDFLTGLFNRAGFLQNFPPPSSGTLVLLDITGLKRINDQHGHTIGDQQIAYLAQLLRQRFASPALAARWGGDELLLLCPGQPAQHIQDQLIQLQQQATSLVSPLPLFSFGLTSLTREETFEQAFALADHQLYLAKNSLNLVPMQLNDQLDILDLTQRLAHLCTLTELLPEALKQLRLTLHFETATFLTLEDQILRVQYLDWESTLPVCSEPPTAFRAGSSCHAQAVNERRTVVSVDYPHDPNALPEVVALGVKSLIITPLLVNGAVVGLIVLSHHSTWKAIPLATVRLLELAALQLSHLLELRLAVQAIRRTLEGGLLGLGAALEARDLETQGHTARVVAMALALGRQLQLSEEALDELRQGAYLHDIGKLSIPDRILLKPSHLNAEEWAIMQTHVEHGVTIAERMPNLSQGAIDVIRAHHEWWNGQGYPAGLTAESIPLLARIFAVCDAYDALTSIRPYKAAWSPQAACEEIVRLTGEQFCPRVATAFLELYSPDLERNFQNNAQF